MIKDGAEVKIIDNRTKEDLTSVTLAQIIFEEEKKKSQDAARGAARDHPAGGEVPSGFIQKRGDPAGRLDPRGGRAPARQLLGSDRTSDRAEELGADSQEAGGGRAARRRQRRARERLAAQAGRAGPRRVEGIVGSLPALGRDMRRWLSGSRSWRRSRGARAQK